MDNQNDEVARRLADEVAKAEVDYQVAEGKRQEAMNLYLSPSDDLHVNAERRQAYIEASALVNRLFRTWINKQAVARTWETENGR